MGRRTELHRNRCSATSKFVATPRSEHSYFHANLGLLATSSRHEWAHCHPEPRYRRGCSVIMPLAVAVGAASCTRGTSHDLSAHRDDPVTVELLGVRITNVGPSSICSWSHGSPPIWLVEPVLGQNAYWSESLVIPCTARNQVAQCSVCLAVAQRLGDIDDISSPIQNWSQLLYHCQSVTNVSDQADVSTTDGRLGGFCEASLPSDDALGQ